MGGMLSSTACYAMWHLYPSYYYPYYAAGYLYPSYTAYRALQRNASNVELVERLATWAVVTVLLQATTRVLDPLLGFWLPLYHPAKIALVIWLVAPATRGAARVFVKHIEPAIARALAELAAVSGKPAEEPDADR